MVVDEVVMHELCDGLGCRAVGEVSDAIEHDLAVAAAEPVFESF